ncbi:hypothetical protein WA1_26315 [Scytonema hofmannii PCC 7110]|uniref:Uncharacterized protein n=1 Tax=Scytonema hofmannii PCC 7110 TaxID=128403 RepID=A0A139X6X8_9CYAN|nr:hypothetical protein WA1_26315 [Scytonema hofmannii PCC 7110]
MIFSGYQLYKFFAKSFTKIYSSPLVFNVNKCYFEANVLKLSSSTYSLGVGTFDGMNSCN